MIRHRSVTGVSSSAEMAGLVMMVLTGISIGSGDLYSAQNGLSPGRGGAGGAVIGSGGRGIAECGRYRGWRRLQPQPACE